MYLVLLSLRLRVVWVRVVLEKLSHICHDGFLIWLVYVHVYRHTHTHHMMHWLQITLHRKIADAKMCFRLKRNIPSQI